MCLGQHEQATDDKHDRSKRTDQSSSCRKAGSLEQGDPRRRTDNIRQGERRVQDGQDVTDHTRRGGTCCAGYLYILCRAPSGGGLAILALHDAFHHRTAPELCHVLGWSRPQPDRVYQPLHRLIADGAMQMPDPPRRQDWDLASPVG
jgi:hypothetical protein